MRLWIAEDAWTCEICGEEPRVLVGVAELGGDTLGAAGEKEVAESCGLVELGKVFTSDGVLEGLEELERKSPAILRAWLSLLS